MTSTRVFVLTLFIHMSQSKTTLLSSLAKKVSFYLISFCYCFFYYDFFIILLDHLTSVWVWLLLRLCSRYSVAFTVASPLLSHFIICHWVTNSELSEGWKSALLLLYWPQEVKDEQRESSAQFCDQISDQIDLQYNPLACFNGHLLLVVQFSVCWDREREREREKREKKLFFSMRSLLSFHSLYLLFLYTDPCLGQDENKQGKPGNKHDYTCAKSGPWKFDQCLNGYIHSSFTHAGFFSHSKAKQPCSLYTYWLLKFKTFHPEGWGTLNTSYMMGLSGDPINYINWLYCHCKQVQLSQLFWYWDADALEMLFGAILLELLFSFHSIFFPSFILSHCYQLYSSCCCCCKEDVFLLLPLSSHSINQS